MADTLTVVLDVGKTLAKLSLWTRAGDLVARETRPNHPVDAGGYVGLDAEGMETWIADTLAGFAGQGRVGAIVPVGHGAAAAVIRDGRLAAPPMDYEGRISAADRRAYEAERDPFALTGSPSLPDGLNLGAQLHLMERLRPGLLGGDAQVLPWPQYWAWRLSGVAASEVSSLGCHTDLWRPLEGGPSDLARRRGWAERLAPLAHAGAVLGPITAEWGRRTGLPADVKVYCGLHDSNAALLAARGFPEIADGEATVLSTGTWFVAMRTPDKGAGVDLQALPEARDCLVNIDVHGRPIPSARFMGGREIEVLTGVDARRIDIRPDQPAILAAAPLAVAGGVRVLPSFAPGVGPFGEAEGVWVNPPEDPFVRRAAVSLYAALMADVALDLIGARARILIEGRFAEAEVFVRGLARLRPRDRIYVSNAHTDVSYGALRLVDPTLRPAAALVEVEPLGVDLEAYRDAWRRDLQDQGLEAVR